MSYITSYTCVNSDGHGMTTDSEVSHSPYNAKLSTVNLELPENGLKIGHLNIQGLVSKLDELTLLLWSNKIDIFGITESKLNEKHPTSSFAIKGFHEPFRKDRTLNKGGGILIYVKENVNCKRRSDLESDDLEHIWLEINQTNSKPFLLSILYRPPDTKISWKNDFEINTEKVQLEDKEIIILGDFNRDLKNQGISQEWLGFISSIGLTQLIENPTRESNNAKTLIDHIYTDHPQNIVWTLVPKLGLSDHYPIFCSRKINPKFSKNKHHLIKYRSFKNLNEQAFLNDILQTDWSPIFQENDVNISLQYFIDKFTIIIDKHAPQKQHRVKKAHQPEWINGEILDAMIERDRFKASGDMLNYKVLRNRVSTLIRMAKCAVYEKKISEGQNNPNSIWKLFKEFRSPNSDKSYVQNLKVDEREIINSEEMSDEFNKFFTSIAANLKEPIPPSKFTDIKDHVDSKVPEHIFFNIPPIHEQRVHKMLLNLNTSKSTGLDDIGPKFLKLSANIIYPYIHHILNLSISQGIFPVEWKTAKVKPLFKTGAKHDINNYRPISILPTLSKLIEKHVHDSFMSYLNQYDLLIKSQSGFRKRHSCETALVHILDKWLKALNDGYIIGVIMVDFKKAFDLVDHSLILQKLKLYKCSDTAITWFSSYLNDRMQKVTVNGEMSLCKAVTCGVPQGSIIGPLLFLLFINDLPFSLSSVTNSTDMYADDTTIYDIQESEQLIEHNLQASSLILEKWCKLNGMVLNTEKTKVLLITTPHKRAKLQQDSLSITFKDMPLTNSNGEKLLGVHINHNLKWDDHINKIKKKISTNLWLLSRIKSFIPLNARILFYKAYIQPHFDFCNVIWGGTSTRNLQKLLTLQKRACKLIFSYAYISFAHSLQEMNCTSIHDRILLHKAKFMYKVSRESVPSYITDMFVKDCRTSPILRYSSTQNFLIPRPNLELFKESMSYSGPSIWNKIPESIRHSNTIESFSSNFLRWLASNS